MLSLVNPNHFDVFARSFVFFFFLVYILCEECGDVLRFKIKKKNCVLRGWGEKKERALEEENECSRDFFSDFHRSNFART